MSETQLQRKKTIFSGIQPTGIFTLGNYLGAVKNWGKLQDEYECIYSVVDLHAITIRQDPAVFKKQVLDVAALVLACGIDPQRSTLFIQSHVPEHTQLCWILSCFSQFGELSRMTQFKDKSAKHADNINVGLFSYPVLMAADILLYKTDLVPVGADQKQHLELARNIAERFNGIFGNVFTVPEPYIQKEGGKISSLTEPTKKMSKSDPNPKSYISLLDEETTIVKKFKSAVTDSDMTIRFAEGKDGINNLLTILSLVTNKTIPELEKDFEGKGYGDFKRMVGEAVAEHLRPIRQEYQRISADKAYLEAVLKKGAEVNSARADRTLEKVYKKLGTVRF